MSKLDDIRLRNDQYQAFGGYRDQPHSAEDVPVLLDALEGVLEVLDNYPAPSKWNDPSGEILTAMEGMERVIRRTITTALDQAQQ